MLRLCQDKFMVNWPIKLALLLTCLVLPGLAAAESMPQQRIELAYDVYLGGFLAGSVDLTVEHGKGRYLISTTSRSHGLLDFLIELRRRPSKTLLRPVQPVPLSRCKIAWYSALKGSIVPGK